jgi:intracellular sulfur oxidation DsrE/DsrF family protein
MVFLSTAGSTWQESVYSGLAGCCRRFVVGSALLLIAQASVTPAQASDDVDALLQRSDAPHGVVFEIAESDESALQELLPRVRIAIDRIRARFPQTEFAVVSHGREEFALQSQYQGEYAQIHQQVQSLVAEDVPVHVCANHASWYAVSAEDFPEYVDVAPTGPGQIELYLQLDYELIFIQSSN